MSFQLLSDLIVEYDKHFKKEGIDPKDVVVTLRVGDEVLGPLTHHICTYDPEGVDPVTVIFWSKEEPLE